MEHRQGVRFRMSLPVAIKVGRNSLGWFTSRDIGSGGIALNCDIDLPRNCVAELSIEVPKCNRIDIETVRAVMVHQENGCIGFMWISREISLQKLVVQSAGLIAA